MNGNKGPCYSCQAYRLLKFVFVVIPVVAGIDKFLNVLTNWSVYLSPMARDMLGDHVAAFLMLVGVVEIIAGLLVLWKPQIFAYVVGIWLLLISLNLLFGGQFYDVAARDFALALSAFALARLSHAHPRHKRNNVG
jgi:hypothetical protein